MTYQLSDNSRHTTSTGQRQTALLLNLADTILIHMIGENHNLGLIGVGDQIHSTAHSLEHFSRNHVVCQVTVSADLQSSQHGDIDVTTSDHSERLGRIKGGATGEDGDGFLASVDDVHVDFFFGGVGAHTHESVFRVDPDLDLGVQEGRGESGHADAQVDVVALLELFGCTTGDSLATFLAFRFVGLVAAFDFTQFLDFEFLLLCCGDDAVDIDAREVNLVGLDLADRDDVFGLYDTAGGCFCHHRTKVSSGVAEDAVACLVDLVGAQDGNITLDSMFQVELLALEFTGLTSVARLQGGGHLGTFLRRTHSDGDFSSFDPCVDTSGGVEGRDTGTTSSDALGNCALRCEFDVQFSRKILLLNSLVGSEERQNDRGELAILNELGKTIGTSTGVVGNSL